MIIAAHLAGTTALAASDPTAGCRKLVIEAEFDASGSSLLATSEPDLVHFPPKFLDRCRGDIESHALVREDGSVIVAAKDHGVICDTRGKQPDADSNSAAGHDWVIGPRFRALRYAPWLIGNKPVCVKIERGRVPETLHRFWSPEEWAHHK